MYISSIFIFIFLVGYAVLIGVIISLLLRKQEIEHLSKNKDKTIKELTEHRDAAKENIKNLNNHIAMAKDKIANYHTELTIASSGIMNLHNRLATANSEITNFKAELTTTIEKRAEVSQSNANAVRRLHLSQISLQASAVTFHNEQKKHEQLIESYRNLEQMYSKLSNTHNTTVEESKRKAKWALGMAIVRAGIDLLPVVGTTVNLVSGIIQRLMNIGEVTTESSEIVAAAASLTDVMENLENLESVSIQLPDDRVNSISIALPEGSQDAFKAAFEQHLMDAEKLELSNLTAFATDAHQQAENLDSMKSLTGREHHEIVSIILENVMDLGLSYYDYHEAHKAQPAEKAPNLNIKV